MKVKCNATHEECTTLTHQIQLKSHHFYKKSSYISVYSPVLIETSENEQLIMEAIPLDCAVEEQQESFAIVHPSVYRLCFHSSEILNIRALPPAEHAASVVVFS
jgi:hypothetical protein